MADPLYFWNLYGGLEYWSDKEPNLSEMWDFMRSKKSVFLDENQNLKLDYDAAHVNMGGNWRMPTKEEAQELIDNTTYEWVENYLNSGVSGLLFSSNINSSSLFFPKYIFKNQDIDDDQDYKNIMIYLSTFAGVPEVYLLYFDRNTCTPKISHGDGFFLDAVRGVCN